jgi:hypothetical protein
LIARNATHTLAHSKTYESKRAWEGGIERREGYGERDKERE